MSRSNFLLLEDLIESIEKIQRYTKDLTFDEFLENELVMDGVVRNFEIIGEAANKISDDVHQKYPEVPWRQIVGFRNRIVHEYFGVDYEIVWNIKEENLENLKLLIQEILNQEK